jgi:exosortase K
MKTRVVVLVVAALTIWALKRHYSEARADDLWWILSPTAQLVSVATDTVFARVPGEGYFSPARLFLIEKSCAGMNFMVAAFGMLVFALFHRVEAPASGASVLGVSLIASYCASVLVNATRITAAIWLADRPAALSGFSSEQVHRVEGIVVYFVGLVLLHELVRRLEHDRAGSAECRS